jgi:hypothetical protein
VVAIKGVSLPVNTAVIVIVALIVLVSIIVYLALFPPQTGCGSLVELGCLELRNKGCDINNDGRIDNEDIAAFDAVYKVYGCTLDQIKSDAGLSSEEFLRHCGCLK